MEMWSPSIIRSIKKNVVIKKKNSQNTSQAIFTILYLTGRIKSFAGNMLPIEVKNKKIFNGINPRKITGIVSLRGMPKLSANHG